MPNFLTTPLELPWDRFLKAASLPLPGRTRGGTWVGDPVTSGVWMEAGRWGSGWRGNGTFDYARAVGRGDTNSIVVGCIRALQKAGHEPPPRLFRPDADGELDRVTGRPPLQRLLDRPNPVFSRRLLSMWETACLHYTGNAYYWKTRSAAGRVLALHPLSPWRVAPVAGADTTSWVDHYAYQADDRNPPLRLPAADVLHLRLDLDPDDPTRGLSPLKSVLKHVFTDEEATSYLNAMLKNSGVPPVLLTPDPVVGGLPMSQDQADALKAKWMATASGDRRGEPVVVPAPMKVAVTSFNPQQMLVDKAQLLPETRICGALGVPPILAYLQVGLNNATYANAEQFQEGFVKNTMVPYWTIMAEQYTFDLVPEFYGDDAQEVIEFDTTEVGALQEDENEKAERVVKLVGGGIMMQNEARREMGLPEAPEGDVYFVPTNVTPTEPDNLIPEEPEPEPEPAGLPGGMPAGLLEAPFAPGGAPPAPTPAAPAAPIPTNGRAR